MYKEINILNKKEYIYYIYFTSLESNGNNAPIEPIDVPKTITSLAVDTSAAFYNEVITSP